MDFETWLVYLLAAIGLSLSPGPNGLLAAARSLVVQFAIMAGTFAAIEIATECLIAGAAHRISPWLKRLGRRFNPICGGLFVAIGVALPLRSRRVPT